MVREELGQLHVLEHQLHILKDSKGLSWCHHVGTWSPQSPWRREHCSALGTWGAHPPLVAHSIHLGSPLVIFINQLVHLFSFLFTLSLITPSSLGEPFPSS
ncbi:unnamed protein product [Microthlaspi erraticum]|uniref:Uncharacterized protein n=1 Tax=Microthlaspi erraticum TaxID=1685480 RepID=A0A6D2K4T9_9BRAS|nr:unnamed protein product [Microthlaspi erraticum]